VQLPLALTPRRSRRLDFLLFAIHLLTGAALPPLALPVAVRLALAVLVIVSLVATLIAQRRREGLVLHLGARGAMELSTNVGARGTVTIDVHTVLLPGLVVLVLRQEGKRIVLPLLADSLGDENFRRLRLWLRARGEGTAVSAAA
jgi:hypothetical protein